MGDWEFPRSVRSGSIRAGSHHRSGASGVSFFFCFFRYDVNQAVAHGRRELRGERLSDFQLEAVALILHTSESHERDLTLVGVHSLSRGVINLVFLVPWGSRAHWIDAVVAVSAHPADGATVLLSQCPERPALVANWPFGAHIRASRGPIIVAPSDASGCASPFHLPAESVQEYSLDHTRDSELGSHDNLVTIQGSAGGGEFAAGSQPSWLGLQSVKVGRGGVTGEDMAGAKGRGRKREDERVGQRTREVEA